MPHSVEATSIGAQLRGDNVTGEFAERLRPCKVFGWADPAPAALFSSAELALDGAAALVVLPLPAAELRSDRLIHAALTSLVDVVVSLFPDWLPGARGIDSAAGAGRAAVVDIVRSTAAHGPLYGPLLKRIAEAAIARCSPKLADVPHATIALECLKLVRAAYQTADVALILPADGPKPAELERMASWLAEHGGCAVWLAGPAVAGMPRIARIETVGHRCQSPVVVEQFPEIKTPWATPLSGRPNPFSDVEQRLEALLSTLDWAVGRSWNAFWQAGDLHNGIRVDLMWADERCVIELDGPEHRTAEHYKADRSRDRLLQSAGYTVLRFTNEEVLEDIEQVVSFIERFLVQRRTLRS